MEYKIGQILVSKEEQVLEKALSEEKEVIPKGSKVIIGADKMAHHIRTGMIQPLGEAKLHGYDSRGIAEYLYICLKKHFEIDEMLEGYNETKVRFIEEIECALEEIGF